MSDELTDVAGKVYAQGVYEGLVVLERLEAYWVVSLLTSQGSSTTK